MAGVLAVLAIANGFLFGAVLAGGFAALNLNQLRQVRQDELTDRLAVAHRGPARAPARRGRRRGRGGAGPAAHRARPGAGRPSWLGWAHLMQGDVDGAVPAALAAAPLLTPSSSLRAAVALADGRRSEGVAVMAWAFAHDEAGPPKSLARRGRGRHRHGAGASPVSWC